MIEMPLIVNRTLAEYRDRQRPLECLLKETLDIAGLRKDPRSRAAITNEGSGFDQPTFGKAAELRDLFVAFDLDQYLGNLRIGAGDLCLCFSDFQIGVRQRVFCLLDLALRYQPVSKQLL